VFRFIQRGRGAVAIVIVGMMIAGGAAFASTPSTSVSPSTSNNAATPGQPTIPDATGVVDQADVQNRVDADATRRAVLATVGERLGLQWFGTAPDGTRKFFVGIKGLADADGPAVSKALGVVGSDVELLSAAWSEKALEQYEQQAVSIAQGDDGVSVGIGVSSLDAGGQPTINVEAASLPDDVIAKLKTVIPNDLLRLELGPEHEVHFASGRAVAYPSSYRFVAPPYQGGLYNSVYDGPSGVTEECTSGFLMVGTYGYFGSTAGHCDYGPDASGVVVGGTVCCLTARNLFWETTNTLADTAIYSVQNFTPRLPSILIGSGFTRVIKSRYNGSAGIGTLLCRLGMYSDNTSCATVNQQHQMFSQGGRTSSEADCIPTGLQQGDSGGPVYEAIQNYAKAAGMISFGSPSMTCYSLINNIVYLSGQEVALG
jgi:hypothetical protein